MAWTAPATVTTGDLMTAAFWNTQVRDNLLHLSGTTGASRDQDVNGFTNTSFADLDALTTAAFSGPVAVTVETGTTALVTVSAFIISQATSGSCFMSYRVSGASTVASDDERGIRVTTASSAITETYSFWHTGLTAGSNTFELQARVNSNNGRLQNPSLVVIPGTT